MDKTSIIASDGNFGPYNHENLRHFSKKMFFLNSKVFNEIKEIVSLKQKDQNWIKLVRDIGKFIYYQYFATHFEGEFTEKLFTKEVFSVCENTLFLVAQIDRWEKNDRFH